jgi:cell wall-associated NlpC family hydrolase
LQVLNKPSSHYTNTSVLRPPNRAVLKPGTFLVEGNLRMSSAIKYLTQSTWSHAAIYIGNQTSDKETDATRFL